ncbi:unnamed protein product, partial [Effrenium voratum]
AMGLETQTRRVPAKTGSTGSRMKDVQRKLDLSLEDLVEESKTGTGKGTRKRRRREPPEQPSDAQGAPPAAQADAAAQEGPRAQDGSGSSDSEAEPEKAPRREQAPAPRRVEHATGARRTGRPPASLLPGRQARKRPTGPHFWPQLKAMGFG